jgi:hypothetical protein
MRNGEKKGKKKYYSFEGFYNSSFESYETSLHFKIVFMVDKFG